MVQPPRVESERAEFALGRLARRQLTPIRKTNSGTESAEASDPMKIEGTGTTSSNARAGFGAYMHSTRLTSISSRSDAGLRFVAPVTHIQDEFFDLEMISKLTCNGLNRMVNRSA